MARGRSVVVGALVASLGLNAYLLFRHGDQAQKAERARAPVARSQPTRMTPPTTPPALSEPPIGKAEYVTLDRAALERRLADTESQLERYLPLSEKFERNPERSPDSEERVHRFLDKSFAGSVTAFSVECHGAVCKTEVDDGAPPDWMGVVQGLEGHGLFSGQEFTGGAHAIWYASLVDPEVSATRYLVAEIVTAGYDLPAWFACREASPDGKGDMTVHVTLDAARRLAVTATGPLSLTARGLCVRKALEDMYASFVIPPEITNLPDISIPVSY